MWKLNLIALCWLLSALPAQAETRVLEDFEGSASSIQARWPGQSYCCFPDSGGPFNLASSPVVNGTQSLRYNFVGSYDELGGFQCCQPGGSAEWDYHFGDKEIWITWYSYMAPGFKTAGGKNATPPIPDGIGGIATKGLYQYMFSPATGRVNGWVFHYFYGGRQLALSAQGIKDAPEGPYGTHNMWPNVTSYYQTDGQWWGYEAHFKLNTPGQANGLYELYVTPPGGSAILVSRYATREFVDTTTSGMMPSDAYWFREKIYRQDGLGSMYLDALRVTTTRIGLGGTPPPPPPGPLPDTSPPNAPTNLNVTELWERVKTLVATVWSWIGPASADAAVPNDKLTLSWENAQVGVDYELRWQSFVHPDWIGLGFIPSSQLKLVVPIAPPISCQIGQDCYVCADARAKRLSDGITGPWLSETPNGKACNQFAVGPIVIPPPPPPPDPVPTVDTFKNILETDLKLSFQYLPADCPKGITKATSATSKTTGLRTVTLTCAK